MAANTERFERLSPTVTPESVTFTHQRRESLNTVWAEAEVVRTVEFKLADLPEQFNDGGEPITLAAYGLNTVLQQRPSGVTDTTEKLEAMEAVYELLQTGEWKQASAARGAAIDPVFVEALAQVSGKSFAVAFATLNNMDAEGRKLVKAKASIQAKIKELKEAAPVDGEIDVDALE